MNKSLSKRLADAASIGPEYAKSVKQFKAQRQILSERIKTLRAELADLEAQLEEHEEH